METRTKRYDPYGFIRLIMALMIAVLHYNILLGGSTDGYGVLIRTVYDICVHYGDSLPICFFVLSGFYIYQGYYDRICNREITFVPFIIKRVKRLYPLMIFSIVIWEIFQLLHMYVFDSWWLGLDSSLWNFAVALTGVNTGTIFDAFNTVNGPIWYISVLIVCYCAFYCLCIPTARNADGGSQLLNKPYMSTVLFSLPLVIGFSVFYYGIRLPFLTGQTGTGYIGFFVGVMLAHTAKYWKGSTGILLSAITVLVFSLLMFIIFGSRLYRVCGTIVCYFGVILFPAVVVIMENEHIHSLTSNSLNNILSALSFPVFLFNMPVYLAMDTIRKVFIPEMSYNIVISIVVVMIMSALWCMAEYMIKRSRKRV